MFRDSGREGIPFKGPRWISITGCRRIGDWVRQNVLDQDRYNTSSNSDKDFEVTGWTDGRHVGGRVFHPDASDQVRIDPRDLE